MKVLIPIFSLLFILSLFSGCNGGDSTASTGESDITTSPDAGDSTPPADEGDSTTPDDGGNSTTSPDEGDNTTPDDGSGDTNPLPASTSDTAIVLAANDLGMHCMDKEFSVFSILPPFNVVSAQILGQDSNGRPFLMDDAEVNVFYDSVTDPSGSLNSYSIGKTDFWTYVNDIFGGTLTEGEGLTGLFMPGDDPQMRGAQPMEYNTLEEWFSAEGIPITPVDDDSQTNTYPLMSISARDAATDEILGDIDIVVPVATETDCRNCHKTGGIAAQGTGWSSDPDIEKQSIGWVDSPGIFTDEMVEGWKTVTERIKPTGTPFFLQLWHCGRASHSDFHEGNLPVSASAVKLNGDYIHTPMGKKTYETPREMTIAEIRSTVDDFKKAAQNAKDAGFSGVEVHGANGYLINQFLDSKSNRRDDEYGGSIENRFRFFKEVLDAVLEVWPADQVGARIAPNGVFNDMGSDDFRELYLYVAGELNKFNLAYLHIMDGLAFGFHEKGDPMTLAEFRAVYDGTIVGNCGYTRELAEERITQGNADIIAFGRPFISNPDLPERFRNNFPLNPSDDMTRWYTPGPEGYTDYSPYS